MELHTLHSFPKSRKRAKRIGRGLGSGHGTYSTRGMKGQRARSGGSKGLKLKGMKQMLLRIPKVRGFRSIHPSDRVVNLSALDAAFENGMVVSVQTLAEKKLIDLSRGQKPHIKILGTGELSKPLSIQGIPVSATAREKIEKAGGSVST